MNTSGWVISCCRFKFVCVVVFVPFKLVFSKNGCHALQMVDFGCVLGGCGKQKGIFLSGFLELLLVEGVRLPILDSYGMSRTTEQNVCNGRFMLGWIIGTGVNLTDFVTLSLCTCQCQSVA